MIYSIFPILRKFVILQMTQRFMLATMKLNKDKCHLLVSGHKYENVWVKMGDEKIWESGK